MKRISTIDTADNLDEHKKLSIIKEYKKSIMGKWIDDPCFFYQWWDLIKPYIGINCMVIDQSDPPKYFRFQSKKWQYDLRRYNLGRPMAWRIPFLMDPNFNNNNYTISHLCHNPNCYNWEHHVLESLDLNKARNGCPGGPHCHHLIKCIRPGPYYNK
jgi:hypothetical protein